jgi:hypothetical protein
MLQQSLTPIIPVILSAFIAGNAQAGTCPEKMSAKLCERYSAVADTAFLRARIVLDAANEAYFSKGEKRPLLVWTEELLGKYDLRTLTDRDSAYRPDYHGDIDPSIDQVMYHNVSARKSELPGIGDEPYVKKIQIGCAPKIHYTLCDVLDSLPDSTHVNVMVFTSHGIDDSSYFEALFQDHEVLNPDNPAERLTTYRQWVNSVYGLRMTISLLNALEADARISQFEAWSKPKILGIQDKPASASIPAMNKSGSRFPYLLNGRKINRHR